MSRERRKEKETRKGEGEIPTEGKLWLEEEGAKVGDEKLMRGDGEENRGQEGKRGREKGIKEDWRRVVVGEDK